MGTTPIPEQTCKEYYSDHLFEEFFALDCRSPKLVADFHQAVVLSQAQHPVITENLVLSFAKTRSCLVMK
jgi:hypothetical protein